MSSCRNRQDLSPPPAHAMTGFRRSMNLTGLSSQPHALTTQGYAAPTRMTP